MWHYWFAGKGFYKRWIQLAWKTGANPYVWS